MGFELALAYVTVKAETRQADREIADVRGLMDSLPPVKSVKITADTSGLKAGLMAAARASEGIPLANSTYDVGPVVAPPKPTPITLDNRQFAAQLAKSRAMLAAFPGFKTTALNVSTKGFAAGLAVARAKLASFGQTSMAAFSGAAGGAIAAQAAFSAIPVALEAVGGAIRNASHYDETVSKVGVVFGEAAGQVTRFSDEMQRAFGSSRNEILDSAAGFGLIGKAAGMSQQEASKLAVSFARLADDATSFYDVPLEESLRTLKSALVGESEPIRRFGVLLNETAVKAEASRLGLAGQGKELSESAKVMARVSLIQQGMADAQGDHARTSGSFANQWREFTGRISDFGQSLGSIALPALNLFLRALNPIIQALGFVADTLRQTIGLFGEFFAKAGDALGVSGAVAKGLPGGASPPGGLPGEPEPGAGSGAGTGTGGVKTGMEAARETVAKEEADKEKTRLVDAARSEADAEKTRIARAKAAANIYKSEWIEAAAKVKLATIEATAPGFAVSPEDAKHLRERNAALAKEFATRDYVSGRLSGTIAKPPEDMKDRREAAEGLLSVAKEKLGHVLDFAPVLKQQGLAVVAKGINALDAAGEASRRKREEEEQRKSEGFRSEMMSSSGLSQRVQTAVLSRAGTKKEEKETAENTKNMVTELATGFATLNATLKQLRGVAVYQ